MTTNQPQDELYAIFATFAKELNDIGKYLGADYAHAYERAKVGVLKHYIPRDEVWAAFEKEEFGRNALRYELREKLKLKQD